MLIILGLVTVRRIETVFLLKFIFDSIVIQIESEIIHIGRAIDQTETKNA